jgi:L-lactate utilization protein LutC
MGSIVEAEGLSQLISTFKAELESLGGRFYLAEDSGEAGKIIAHIAKGRNSRLAVKSRLPCEEEMRIVEALAEAGTRAIEVGEGDRKGAINTIANADMGISGADLAIAQTGTIAIATERDIDRLVTCLPPVHVAIVPLSALVRDFRDALPYLRKRLGDQKPQVISFISGPSRTADIELRMVLGAHGPHELHVVMLRDK